MPEGTPAPETSPLPEGAEEVGAPQTAEELAAAFGMTVEAFAQANGIALEELAAMDAAQIAALYAQLTAPTEEQQTPATLEELLALLGMTREEFLLAYGLTEEEAQALTPEDIAAIYTQPLPEEDDGTPKTAEELATFFGMSVEELAEALEITVEELEALTPESIAEIYMAFTSINTFASSGYSGSNYTNNRELAQKLTNVFDGNVSLFSNVSTRFTIGDYFIGTYYWEDNDYSGAQCYAYAQAVYSYLFGESPVHGDRNYKYSTVVMRNKTTAAYNDFVNAGVACGAYIRTTINSNGSYNGTSGHSMIVLTYNKDSITVLHANYLGTNKIAITTYSWSAFNEAHLAGYDGRRIAHIVQPNLTKGTIGSGSSSTSDEPTIAFEQGRYRVIKGCDLKEEPYAAAKSKGAVEVGDMVDVIAIVKNKYDNMWVKTSDGRYIYAGYTLKNGSYVEEGNMHLQLASNTVTCSISGASLPSGTLEKGKMFSLRGTIDCTNSIQKIVATVKGPKNISSQTVFTDTLTTNKDIYPLDVNMDLSFGSLPEGSYSFELTVYYYYDRLQKVGTYTPPGCKTTFTIGSGSSSQPQPPPPPESRV